MSLISEIKTALSGITYESQTVEIGEGNYPSGAIKPCGKIVFTGEDKPVHFMGGGVTSIETFKVIIKGIEIGDDYAALEDIAALVKSALVAQGCVQIGGYENIEPQEGETFMQLAVKFKAIGQIKTV